MKLYVSAAKDSAKGVFADLGSSKVLLPGETFGPVKMGMDAWEAAELGRKTIQGASFLEQPY